MLTPVKSMERSGLKDYQKGSKTTSMDYQRTTLWNKDSKKIGINEIYKNYKRNKL